MIKLTHENFIKARKTIFANSDDINRAWFRYNFEDGDTDAFMDVLAKYQYDNGGFGGLVYEFEYQGPCLKCTEHALRYMFYLKEKPPADHPHSKDDALSAEPLPPRCRTFRQYGRTGFQ